MDAAANIPPELFDDVLWYVCRHEQDPNVLQSRDDRRNMSVCGRVCRRWSVLCRPKLFDYVTLRSAEDVQEFKALLASPPPSPTTTSFSDHMRSVVLDVRDDVPPWMHLVWLSIIPRLRVSSREICLNFSASHPEEPRGFGANRTGLYGLLPRSIPSMAPVLTLLELTSVHFSNGAELCRFLASHPMLMWIALHDLSWTTPPTCEDFYSLQLGPGVEMIRTSCKKEQELLATWFFSALVTRGDRPLRHPSRQPIQSTAHLHPTDCEYLLELLDILQGPEISADAELQRWDIRCIEDSGGEMQTLVQGKCGDRCLIPCIQLGFKQFENTDHASTPENPFSGARYDTHIVYIVIDFVYRTASFMPLPDLDSPGARYKTSDWELLTSTVSSLSRLRKLSFMFPSPSTADNLLKAHGSTMECLLHHDRLTVKSCWKERKYDPVEGCMRYFEYDCRVKAKTTDVQDTTKQGSETNPSSEQHAGDESDMNKVDVREENTQKDKSIVTLG